MEKEVSFWCFLLVLFVLCLVPQNYGKRLGIALDHLYKAKLWENSVIDTSNFKPVEYIVKNDVNAPLKQESKEQERISQLPGQPSVGFNQYSGYVTIDEKAGRALFYYFAEAEYSKESLPLLLWLNGGPGCSSLGYGAMQEVGPFRVQSNGTLSINKFAWNQVANVLFLETPAGVGFSYSNKSSENVVGGDGRTAVDNYIFLVNWFNKFPEYKDRAFYIAGESYAGHYVPQLAQTILHQNSKKTANPSTINLKGIMIGNALINYETDRRGRYDYLATHAIISDETNIEIQTQCNFSATATFQSPRCVAALKVYRKDVANIDIYNIYAPLCPSSNNTKIRPDSKTNCEQFDPCSDNYVHAYLNRPDVQQALHANLTKLKYPWSGCSETLEKWEDSPSSMFSILQELMANGVRLWLYSGDIDGVLPVTSTKSSIKAMNMTTKFPWYPWYLNEEVAGYALEFNGLTFSTIRGAGHEAPSYEPNKALALFTHFLSGTLLPNTSKQN
ncbi:serine carboxypeptidase-like 40 [Malania oleifera]|uniref:serine carboxypeptidase-like 40 n=1 Tax=Malania oleifera TaxID=397392 RepID=UPI0025ADB036|nr:serine carboxypeptidase-like 40 [Malania oleifera]